VVDGSERKRATSAGDREMVLLASGHHLAELPPSLNRYRAHLFGVHSRHGRPRERRRSAISNLEREHVIGDELAAQPQRVKRGGRLASAGRTGDRIRASIQGEGTRVQELQPLERGG